MNQHWWSSRIYRLLSYLFRSLIGRGYLDKIMSAEADLLILFIAGLALADAARSSTSSRGQAAVGGNLSATGCQHSSRWWARCGGSSCQTAQTAGGGTVCTTAGTGGRGFGCSACLGAGTTPRRLQVTFIFSLHNYESFIIAIGTELAIIHLNYVKKFWFNHAKIREYLNFLNGGIVLTLAKQYMWEGG